MMLYGPMTITSIMKVTSHRKISFPWSYAIRTHNAGVEIDSIPVSPQMLTMQARTGIINANQAI